MRRFIDSKQGMQMRVDRLAVSARVVVRRARRHRLAACLALLSMPWAVPAAAAVCYVNGSASGSNTGASWADAYTDLQSALTDANCIEVWVAQGVYKPVAPVDVGSVTPTEQAVSFNVSPNVAVYGGFSGVEAIRTERDPAAHVTILSGDLDNNDDNNNVDGNFIDETSADIVGSNSRHIVVINGTAGTPVTASTVLDGFTLTGGYNKNAEGGGALWCRGNGAGHECSPTLARLVLSGNRASGNGGAMVLDGYSGGASSPTLTDVTFRGNSAATFGGAMYNNGQGSGGVSSPVLTNVTFSGNGGVIYGGAMFNDGAGGGISSPTLTNATFFGNSATGNGGATFNNGGGGTSSPKFTNVTFNGNSASYGGAIYNQGISGGTSISQVINSILWGDSATTSGAEFYSSYNGGGTGETSLYSSIVEGGCDADCGGVTIYQGDPKLGTLADNGGFTLTLTPGTGSAAINAIACDASVPLTDQRGAARPDPVSTGATRCDIGAVEADSLPFDVIFVDSFGSSPRDL